MTSHPKDLSDRLVGVIAKEPIFCRHVHLCVQHGSDRILAAMNRKYDTAYFRSLAQKLRTSIPGVSLSTDILVGFPGETEEDLESTLALMRDLRFEFAYMYYYNKREGTAAAKMPQQLPEKVKKERLAKVIELQRAIGGEALAARVGLCVLALVEDVSRRKKDELLGRTEREEMVVFKGERSLIGRFVQLRLDSLSGTTFKGTVVGTVD
jgi:tRNA-2-methylthio-N6-dimethylallyladenosine synthase